MGYVIVGAGAIGGTLGHHLARAGHEVTVVDAEHVRSIRERGIVVRRGDEHAAADAATDALVAWLRTQTKDRSGIWRDIAVRRRPTEVSTHYGPVLHRAAQLGIAVPGLERLVAQIEELEGGAPMTEQRIDDLAGALR
ncbi:ketopantoate reductase family protein [Pseudonocardia alaniniphila]|uniref:Ketopantoate reductase N-terminal domain-containing protein n=1 Tax=Pseudonocardia alaniniphila TaxID=75291 RepID=A0ABS9TK71_9PSEU|nr:2-dehydropantoate 2-reductase N-terminal domain-containing protein [Pseudonocardia alaniniphila]MCH6168940.1 hypothetical protein [Pseudonocardia alaniniphila]